MTVGTGWTMDLGDCRHVLNRDDLKADHLISDPPFSKDLYTRMKTNNGNPAGPGGAFLVGQRLVETAGGSFQELANNAIGSVDDCLDAVASFARNHVRRWVIVFHDDLALVPWIDAMSEAGFQRKRTSVWLKPDPMPQLSGDRPAQDVEYFTCFHRKGSAWNGGGKPASIVCPISKGKYRPDHPSPKPLRVMEHLIRLFTNPGDLVLDPFAGSGTTGVAALKAGRRFHGIERHQPWHELACKRLAQTREQYQLFAESAP